MATSSAHRDSPVLVGRTTEGSTIDALLGAAADGLSGALVLRGEPGVGKTALLDRAVATADGWQVARVEGVQSEMAMGYAALHRLLLPHLDRRDDLPPPQAEALGAAFGLMAGPPPDRFLVGLATLTVLAGVAEHRPLLCVVDDAQWLDRESAEVLAFVGRRLLAEGLVLLFAVRAGSELGRRLDGLTVLEVAGLDEADAIDLLRAAASDPVDADTGRRLAEAATGNPLALLELGRSLDAEQLRGDALLPEPLPLGHRLEARYLEQVHTLTSGARGLLTVAAVDTSGDPDLVGRAAETLGADADAVAEVEGAGLACLHPDVRFRHPLVRSAILGGVPQESLRQAHAALAGAIDPDGDPVRRAWHRAGSTPGPDDEVAAELEAAAQRTRARGGWAGAGLLLTRAAELSGPAGGRGLRLLGAAEAVLAAGDPLEARRLLHAASPDLTDPLPRAHALRLEGAIRFAAGDVPDAPALLLEAAQALEPFDPRLARDTLLDASSAAIYGGRAARTTALAEVARAAAAVPSGATPTSGDLLLDGFATLFTEGHAAGAPKLRAALTALEGDDEVVDQTLRWLGFGCWAAGALGDYERMRALATRLVRLCRERGVLVELTRGLYFLAMGDLVAGDLDHAAAHFAENQELMDARGGGSGLGELMATAWRGDAEATRDQAAAVVRTAEAHGQRGILVYADHALGVLELALGHYEAALAATVEVDAEDSYFLSTVALPDLVEAAARAGDRDAAVAALARCRTRAEVNGTSLALGLLARAEALLADGDEADACHRAALEHLGATPAVGHQARAHLLYGEWLRRRNRRVDAREHLRRAHEAFAAIGAAAFAERARVELLATGERARKRSEPTTDELTPQERKVAELAAARATNAEIAAQLFISPGTVDYHLRKVFRKLGINSRRRLADALTAAER